MEVHWKMTIAKSIGKVSRKTSYCGSIHNVGLTISKGVAERRDRTLMDMMRSMISNSDLALSLWSEALKTLAYVLNRVLTKAVHKMPFEF